MKPPRVLAMDEEPLARERRSPLLRETGFPPASAGRVTTRVVPKPEPTPSRAKTRRTTACDRGLGTP